ncbi:MAG: Uma2 family endonuclease [Chloroflexi bacterium]|nr:Uma2 family endonuclease [Chloroflexota bacterium]
MVVAVTTVDRKRAYTADEFEELPNDKKLYELIERALVRKMSPGDEHGQISFHLLTHLILLDPQHKLGMMWPGTSFRLNPTNVPIPDLAFVVAGRIPPKSKKAMAVIPDLVVEVHSPRYLASQARRTLTDLKIRLYQVAGVQIIWAINPSNQTVEVYHQGQLAPVVVLSLGDDLDGEAVIPGFKLRVSQLFK